MITLTRADVLAGYAAFLHRAPESEAVIAAHMQHTLHDFLTMMLNSAEYRSVAGLFRRSFDWPAIYVETSANSADLAAMMNHVEKTWHRLGETNPHWSVLSDPKFTPDRIASTKEEFFASGAFDAQRIVSFANRAGVTLSGSTCLELGCGLGRVTAWLAPHFTEIYALDVSAPHLGGLECTLASRGITNVRPCLIESIADLGVLPPYNAFFSIIVLQHNPPPVMLAMLRAILDGLSGGGIAYFQVPTYRLGYRFSVAEYLRSSAKNTEIEMHVLPQAAVLQALEEAGCQLIEMREDEYTGHQDGISNTFFARKRD